MAQRAPKTVLSLEYNPPMRLPDGRHQVDAVAIVSEGQNTLEGESVKFYFNNLEDGAEPTDSEGRASYTLIAPAGMHNFSIGAQIEGKSARSRKVITIPMPPARKPDRWFIDPVGSRGNHTLLISIISEDRSPVSGVLLEIVDLNPLSPRLIFKNGEEEWRTDADGKVRIPLLTFQERYRTFLVKAPGTGFQPRRLRLAGPPRWKTPPRARDQKIDVTEIQASPGKWWHNYVPSLLVCVVKAFSTGWKKGQEEYKKP